MKYAILVVIGAAACGGRQSRVEHLDARPAALAKLEATADLAYERALAGDSAGVSAASTRAIEDWTQVRPELDRRGAEADVLVEMDGAVLALGKVARASVDPIALGRAANRITGALDELYAV